MKIHLCNWRLLVVMVLILGVTGCCKPASAITPTSTATTSPSPAPTQTATAIPMFDRLARTPPMGWNSFNHFGCSINDDLVRETADAMVSSGMSSAGYQYVIIDDCWMAPTRDANGDLQPDPTKFPNGLKAVVDYVHAKGLKFGIYLDRGTKTCALLPGSYGYEIQDANKIASWGVDYLKYDNCAAVGKLLDDYTKMHKALVATGRPIVFSMCSWGFPGI